MDKLLKYIHKEKIISTDNEQVLVRLETSFLKIKCVFEIP